MTRIFFALTCLVTFLGSSSNLYAQPAGFVDDVFLTGFVQATSLAFDDNGRMYVAEKEGKIWIVDGGVKSANPLIDLTEEVGNWGDYGLVGFVLDPNFLSNGYIYLMYVVDRHYLFYFGTPSYNANANEPFNATIGRITRYTAESSTNFTTVDYSSRKILMGETKETGMPILHTSHGVGTILFGEDGTLLATLGDGASFNGDDLGGGVHGDYAVQALIDGILDPNEDVGAFRSQMLNSLNGKVIRIDPNTGEGVASNPFYDAMNPGSTRSKVWALGLRNPFRMTRKPGTGSHYATDGDPGILFVGDVGSGTWEEMNVVTQPGMNFGWPMYEGMDVSPGYMNANIENQDAPTPGGCAQSYYRFNQLLQDYTGDSSAVTFSDPCNPGNEIDGNTYNLYFHTKPALDWKHGTSGFARSAIDGVVSLVGSGDVKGTSFYGNASVGGVWYTASDFPEEYRNLYYHGDYGTKWIRTFKFNDDHEPDSTDLFDNTTGSIVNMAASEAGGGIYYIRYSTSAQIRRLYYTGSINQPPTAAVTSDTFYTPDPSLTVNFDATGSTDPENAVLTYAWDFGDGTLGVGATPSHTYG
ncbi:MAG: PQQ-dependent sugar dehydrogenase, partial [Bacteroidota bacterium]